MTRRNLNATTVDPHGLSFELGATARQRLWRVCCQSIDDHRFDCTAIEPEKRGAGPFGPSRLVVPLLVVDEPQPGTLRVREVRR